MTRKCLEIKLKALNEVWTSSFTRFVRTGTAPDNGWAVERYPLAWASCRVWISPPDLGERSRLRLSKK